MKQWTAADIQHRLEELSGDSADPDIAALRKRILQTASEHFAKFGYRRANIGDIARDVGIGKGSLYLHFDSKETLLIAAVSFEKMALVPEFQALMALPEAEQLEAYLRMALRFITTSALTSRLMRGDPEIDRILSKRLDSDDAERSRTLIANLIAGSAPTLSEAQRHELADLLHPLLTLPAHLGSSTNPYRISREVFVDRYARILTLGIQALGNQ